MNYYNEIKEELKITELKKTYRTNTNLYELYR